MNPVARILVVAGFCVGTLGAAGFAEEVEPMAWPLFGVGLAGLAAGGFLHKVSSKKGAGAAAGADGAHGDILERLERIRGAVVALDEQRASWEARGGREDELRTLEHDLRHGIDHLLANEYFDLTSENETIASRLGFARYARVWDGVARAERLLSRVWSLGTDGFLREALPDLALARTEIERAVREMATG